MRILLAVVAVFVGLLNSACQRQHMPEVHVFAAASLSVAFSDLTTAFEAANPGVRVVANFAGSQVLRVQIEEGASADVFVSANEVHMGRLEVRGFLQDPIQFATRNDLVLAVPAGNPANVRTLGDLSAANRRVVMAGEAVPAGAYARETLARFASVSGKEDIDNVILDRVISFETNVRLVATKLELGEADAGFVYRTDVRASDGRLAVVELPENIQVSARYPIAILREAKRADLAELFVSFVRSDTGQTILDRNGFGSGIAVD